MKTMIPCLQLAKHMSSKVALFTALCTFWSCNMQSEEKNAVITIDLKSPNTYLEDKTLYLGNTMTRNFEDSTVVKNGQAQFNIKTENDFLPFNASIIYKTVDPKWTYQIIGFKNPYIDKTFESTFYVDRGISKLEMHKMWQKNDSTKVVNLNFVNINKQTEAVYKHLRLKTSPLQSQKNRDFNSNLVEKYSYSFEMLSLLNFNKGNMKESELKHLLSLFDKPVKNTTRFKTLAAYAAFENKTGTSFPPDILLKKPNKNLASQILDDKKKYNLVVFWASWCGPCRMEIPQIKSLYGKHKNDLNIVSISTDKNEKQWQTALTKEQMPWKQYLINDENALAKLDKKYHLESIPVWLLFDANHQLIDRQVGYSPGADGIEEKVETHLKIK